VRRAAWALVAAAAAMSVACARARHAIAGGAPPLESSRFVADFDSARVIVIALQGTIERYPDRLLVIVDRATIAPPDSDQTLRAAIARGGAPPWTFTATSGALSARWIYHGGGGAPWTPMRFVIPVRDSTGEAQRALVFVFDSGIGERGGIRRRVVPAELVRAPGDR